MEDDDSDDSCDFCEFSNPSQFFNELSYHVVKCADCHEFVPLNPSFSPKICIHLSKSKCNEKKPKRIKCYSSTESDNDSVTSSELHCDKCGYQMTRHEYKRFKENNFEIPDDFNKSKLKGCTCGLNKHDPDENNAGDKSLKKIGFDRQSVDLADSLEDCYQRFLEAKMKFKEKLECQSALRLQRKSSKKSNKIKSKRSRLIRKKQISNSDCSSLNIPPVNRNSSIFRRRDFNLRSKELDLKRRESNLRHETELKDNLYNFRRSYSKDFSFNPDYQIKRNYNLSDTAFADTLNRTLSCEICKDEIDNNEDALIRKDSDKSFHKSCYKNSLDKFYSTNVFLDALNFQQKNCDKQENRIENLEEWCWIYCSNCKKKSYIQPNYIGMICLYCNSGCVNFTSSPKNC